jgi:hypothetical protein
VINEEEEEEEPIRCYLVFHYTYDRLNMFQAPLCSGTSMPIIRSTRLNHRLPHGPSGSQVVDGWRLGAGWLAA